jgi:virginiamycin B lyase
MGGNASVEIDARGMKRSTLVEAPGGLRTLAMSGLARRTRSKPTAGTRILRCPGFCLDEGTAGGVAMGARTTKWIGTVCGLAFLAGLAAAPPASAFVYWANVNITKAIGRANLDGSGANQSFVPDTPNHDPCGVAVDASHVYWATHSFFNPNYTLDTTIGRANLDGSGANQSFIGGASGPCGVAVDSGHIYWANEGIPFGQPGSTIGRANLDGSGANQSFIRGASAPCGVAVDSGHVYWANVISGTIGRAPLAGGEGKGIEEEFITGANHPCGVAVDSGHIYWANSGWGPSYATGTTIGRANLDGSGADQGFITGASGPSGVAVDSGHIYWANSDFPPSSIGRANLDGSGADQNFISADANPNGVAVDTLQAPPSGRSNRFQIRKLRRNFKRGTAIMVVRIFSPGKLVLSGPAIKLAKKMAASAGKVELTVRPKRAAKLKLRRRHRLRTSVKVRYLPTGGSPVTKIQRVVLILKP